MEVRQTQQSAEKLWHIMLIFQEVSPCLWINPGKTMTIIKFLVFIRERGSIEPCIFVAYFLITFPTAVSYFRPTKVKKSNFFIKLRGLGSSEGRKYGK